MTPQPHPRATLSRRQRIIRTGEFQAVYSARARAGDGRLVVYARPNGRADTRLGISVGRRCGGAVVRNRIKRLIREAFRQGRAALPHGHDIVVVALPGQYAYDDVRQRLGALVSEAIRRSRAAAERKADAGGEGP